MLEIQCPLTVRVFTPLFKINELTFQAGLNFLENKKNLEIRKIRKKG